MTIDLKTLASGIKAMIDGFEDLKLEALLQTIETGAIERDLLKNLIVLGFTV